MSADINILHLSDLHMSQKNFVDIRFLLKAFFDDIKEFKMEKGIDIDFICFTGDLIWDGSESEKQIELAMDEFILPLLEKTGLTENEFFIVPGNHEINRNEVNNFLESGLSTELKSRKEINDFIDRDLNDNEVLKKLRHFKNIKDLFSATDKCSNKLSSSFIRNFNDYDIGFSCLNSCWRSVGNSLDDKNNLIIGERQIQESHEAIKDCDYKFVLMHHPLEWIDDTDRKNIDKLLYEYDFVLTGHLHDLNELQTISRGNPLIFSSSGSMYAGRKGRYNGYSLINLNPITSEAKIYFREYLDARDKFVEAKFISDNGIIEYELNNNSALSNINIADINKLKNGFSENVDNNLVTGLIEDIESNSLEQIFVHPKLDVKSEYIKEKESEKEEFSFDKLMNSEDDLLFIGKKETGKTTLLNYIALQQIKKFNKKAQIPFVVNLKAKLAGNSPIENQMVKFLSANSNNNMNLRPREVKELLEEGNCIILFDDLIYDQGKKLKKVNEFLLKYPDNRFIFTLRENFFQTMSEEYIPELNCNYKKFHIQTLSKNNIRKLTENMLNKEEKIVDEIIKKIMLYFSHLGIPRTPLNVSLILSIYSKDLNYTPYNEASIMERFMEIILEKLSLAETKTSTYDFSIKEKYLSELAFEMNKTDEFCLDKNDFLDFNYNYFKKRGWDLEESNFNNLFFDKKVLIGNDDKVYFRYKSIAEYYLAKKAIKDEKFLEFMLKDMNYLDYFNELNFLTGLERDRNDILFKLKEKVRVLIEDQLSLLDDLTEYDIGLELPFDSNNVKEKIKSHKLNQNERDKMSDIPDKNNDFEAQRVNKSSDIDSQNDELKVLFNSLLTLGKATRNSEELDMEIKAEAVEICIDGYCIILALFRDLIENGLNASDFNRVNNEFNSQISEDELDKLKDVFKIIFPLAIQNFISENMGTEKLKVAINQIIEKDNNEFVEFMLTFLYSDLKLKGSIRKIEDLYKNSNSNSIKKLIVYKVLFYYSMSYFYKSKEHRLVNLAADIILDLKTSSKRSGRLKSIAKSKQKNELVKKIESQKSAEELLEE